MTEGATTFYDIVSLFAKDYHVPDILLPTSSCIFVLESPHVQEVQHGAPVAGSSGVTMSKHLFNTEYARTPLGLLMKQCADRVLDEPILNGIGLVNVCNIPLQKSAYGEREMVDNILEWFHDMEYVRTTNQKETYSRKRQMDIQDWLIDHLRTKLTPHLGREITLVPCGRFAQKFVRLAGLSDPNWRIIEEVPHPSYNSWDRARYQNQIRLVSEAVAASAKKSAISLLDRK
ncbi:hypothetical protein [Alicyclobacillus dauci]|uniref:Uracil DNA glycosylase superfamily protein n=1 Tax=Alicyclobacillus dauci TaxID=1475485 RepID=A0ABY6Z2G5_9BACL|nr:hypothetical protein [Alicyclobacillus dauci]WAH36516.1 hypothetical protein NZD86_20275 [Alicyclobacillus dauci]